MQPGPFASDAQGRGQQSQPLSLLNMEIETWRPADVCVGTIQTARSALIPPDGRTDFPRQRCLHPLCGTG